MTTPVAPCANCGFVLAGGKDWSFINPNYCVHTDAQRYCSSCSEWWYRVGMEPSWDEGLCEHEDCPDCAASHCESTNCAAPDDYRDDLIEVPVAEDSRVMMRLCPTCHGKWAKARRDEDPPDHDDEIGVGR